LMKSCALAFCSSPAAPPPNSPCTPAISISSFFGFDQRTKPHCLTRCATLTITISDHFWRKSRMNGTGYTRGRPMRNRFLTLLILGIMVLGIAAPARAQTTAVDPATLQYQALAGEAARDILTLAGSREFNTMYDLMHPD